MPVSTLLDEHNQLVRNPTFAARVRTAFTRVAREVLSEDPETPGNPLRVSLARTVLNPSDFTNPGLTPVIAADPDISAAAAAGYQPDVPDSAQAAVTDEQILTAVRNAWNLTAGVTTA
ncbi:hypothetical protein QR97_02215 [Streptomyces sp. PBH53]|uniref:hypothetical protein n=1 Tax=Streptomyces sp. PBH53 TaxID=1577075 RepID=UPI000654DB27|nr:hypothetical protein [Streptomyces sp. PBH53]AKN68773.1 hypothetical protein QR97_02215 [Streptomyces sp. PBH53]